MKYERLTSKQEKQLIRLCEEFQPLLPFDKIVFMELVMAAREYCDGSVYPFFDDKNKRFQELFIGYKVAEIKRKYYFFGATASGKPLTIEQFAELNRYVPRVKISLFKRNDMRNYRPIEKVLFIKIVRACRDYMRANMSEEAEAVFFEKLNTVYDAMESNAQSCQRATNNINMTEDRVLTMAKSALRLANIIRYENKRYILDISLLRAISDDELMIHRNVGKATIEKIREIRKSLEWL